MDDSVWRRGLIWVLAVLLILTVAWFAMRWLNPDAPVLGEAEASSLKAEYQQLRNRTDSVSGSWLRTLNTRVKDVQGDLIWNPTVQKGMMRFINLPKPGGKQRYQLWIHDSRAPDGKPLLGAVLASGSGKQELFVALAADKPVLEPFKFVLTLGEPGATEAESQIMLMVQP